MRVLFLFERLNKGDVINKKTMAQYFVVSEKTIWRDLEDLKNYLAESQPEENSLNIKFDRMKKGYVLERKKYNTWLTNQEILAVAKVLLESRAFSKRELEKLLEKLILQSAPEQRRHIDDVIKNERSHYIQLQHGQELTEILWDLSKAVQTRRVVELFYMKVGAETPAIRIVEPHGIIFSEYYFYLIAYIQGVDREFPVAFRLDRINKYKVRDKHFYWPDSQRFEEGEFRKRVQFMQIGKLIKLQFRFWGHSIEAVFDRLPNAQVLARDTGKGTLIEAEVFGRGIKMWLLSQAQYLEVVKPIELREEIEQIIAEMMKIYQPLK